MNLDPGEAGFRSLIKRIEEEGITQQIQIFLSVLLPKSLVSRSINLLYKSTSIKCHVARRSRRTYWTMTSNHHQYFILSDENLEFCSCLSYQNNVVKNGEYPFCKHILAIIISQALLRKGNFCQISIMELEDEQFAEMIASSSLSMNYKMKKT